jgi:type VI secretion system secreted protein Hcp
MTRSIVLSRTRVLALAVAATLLALVAWQLLAPRPASTNVGAATGGVHITMTVKGHKQGSFKGEDNAGPKKLGIITVVGYQYEVSSPRDAASGLPTGKRQHKPVVITHEMAGSSPQFLNALATNEVLDEVVINFFRTERTGQEVNYYTVKLTDATVSDDKQYTSGNTVLEDIAFTFRKIEQEDKIAKTMFVDDWSSPVT